MTGEGKELRTGQDVSRKGSLSVNCERLTKLFDTGKLSDMTLVASCGRRLACHRVVLAASSDRLERLVTEETGTEITCTDVDGETLELVLRFLYTSGCALTVDNALAVLRAARKFGIAALENLVVAFLAGELTIQSCCQLYGLAESEGLESLRKRCLGLAAERWEFVYQTEGFLALNLDQLKGMLKTTEVLGCREVDLFKAACCWVLRDIQRVEHLEEILALVNFPQMSSRELRCIQELLCLKYQEVLNTSHWPLQNAQAVPAQSEKVLPVAAAGSPTAVEPQRTSVEPLGKVLPDSRLVSSGQLLQVLPQVENMMGVLPVVLSLQASQLQPGLMNDPNGLLPVHMNGATQMHQLQELMVAQLTHQGSQSTGVSAPLPTHVQIPQHTGTKQAAAGKAGSQDSENRAQQDCSDVVSGTGAAHIMGETARPKCVNPAAKDSLLEPRTPQLNQRVRCNTTGGNRISRCVCQVEGCRNSLAGLRDYHVRYKICDHHLKVSSILKDGRQQRFCQQCGRFHELAEFDGNKRSCRARLMRHNARRRKRLRPDPDCLQGSGVALPVMQPHPLICLFSTNPGSAIGGNLEVPLTPALRGTPVPRTDYLSTLPGVSQALTLTHGSALLSDSMVEKIVSPVVHTVERSLCNYVGNGTKNDKTATNNSSLQTRALLSKDGVQEENVNLDVQGIVR